MQNSSLRILAVFSLVSCLTFFGTPRSVRADGPYFQSNVFHAWLAQKKTEADIIVTKYVPYGGSISQAIKDYFAKKEAEKIQKIKRITMTESETRQYLVQMLSDRAFAHSPPPAGSLLGSAYWAYNEIDLPFKQTSVPLVIEGAWYPLDSGSQDNFIWYARSYGQNPDAAFYEIYAYDLGKIDLHFCLGNWMKQELQNKAHEDCSSIPLFNSPLKPVLSAFKGGFLSFDLHSFSGEPTGIITNGHIKYVPTPNLIGLGKKQDGTIVLEPYNPSTRYEFFRQNVSPLLSHGQITAEASEEKLYSNQDTHLISGPAETSAAGLSEDGHWLYFVRSPMTKTSRISMILQQVGSWNAIVLDKNEISNISHFIYVSEFDLFKKVYLGFDKQGIFQDNENLRNRFYRKESRDFFYTTAK